MRSLSLAKSGLNCEAVGKWKRKTLIAAVSIKRKHVVGPLEFRSNINLRNNLIGLMMSFFQWANIIFFPWLFVRNKNH
jgi:hypothetical protein